MFSSSLEVEAVLLGLISSNTLLSQLPEHRLTCAVKLAKTAILALEKVWGKWVLLLHVTQIPHKS